MGLNTYYPNESIRFTTGTIYVLTATGLVVAAPIALTLNLVDSGGNLTQYPNALIPDAPGQYHQDVTMSTTPALGRWTYYWTSQGSAANQYGVSLPLNFYVAGTGLP